MHRDRLIDACGPAIVEIRARVSKAPQGRRSPFVDRRGSGARSVRGLGTLGPGWCAHEHRVRGGVLESRAHVVQEQVAVDSIDSAQLRQMTVSAAYRPEGPLAGPELLQLLFVGRLD